MEVRRYRERGKKGSKEEKEKREREGRKERERDGGRQWHNTYFVPITKSR